MKCTIEDTKCELTQKEMVKMITDLTEDISAANIAYWRKDDMRMALKGLKKSIDDRDRARKAAVLVKVVEDAKKLIQANKDIPYIIYELDAYAQNKALDGALKQVKAISPTTAAMFYSADPDTGKVLFMAQVSKDTISNKGFRANDWCSQVLKTIDGKGGGKPENAQASGTNLRGIAEAKKIADDYAISKLGANTKHLVIPPGFAKDNDAASAPVCKKESLRKQKLSLKEILQENFAILHCNGQCSPLANLVRIAWEYYGSTTKKLHINETSPTLGGSVPPPLRLEYESGIFIDGAPAIATYFISSGRRGHSMADSLESTKAEVLQWLFYAVNEVRPAIYSWVTSNSKDKKGIDRSMKEASSMMAKLNDCLLTKTYLVGERISCADIAMITMILPAAQFVMNKSYRDSYGNVFRWMNTCLGQPEFIKVLGKELQFC